MIKYLYQNIFQTQSTSFQLEEAEDIEKQAVHLENTILELNELFVELADYVDNQVILFCMVHRLNLWSFVSG